MTGFWDLFVCAHRTIAECTKKEKQQRQASNQTNNGDFLLHAFFNFLKLIFFFGCFCYLNVLGVCGKYWMTEMGDDAKASLTLIQKQCACVCSVHLLHVHCALRYISIYATVARIYDDSVFIEK